MIVSSHGGGNGSWRGRCEGPAFAQQCPDHVDGVARDGEQGLGVDHPFAALFVVEGAAGSAGPHARQRGSVEHPSQHAVIAFRAARLAGHAAGFLRHGHGLGVGGQASRTPSPWASRASSPIRELP